MLTVKIVTKKEWFFLLLLCFFIKKREKSDFLAIFNDFFTQKKNSEKFYKKIKKFSNI